MTNIKISSPAISNFYRAIASDLHNQIPSYYSSLEVVAASTSIAKRLAGDSEPDRSHFRDAIQIYMQDLPNDQELAIGIIKYDAGVVLGIPQLKSEHDKLTAAREALAEAEAEVAQIQAEQGRRLQRIQQLDRIVDQATVGLAPWNLDWDWIETNAEEVISEFHGVPFGHITPRDNSRLQNAFTDLQRAPILRKLAPAAIAKLEATITTAQAELDQLRASLVQPTPQPAPEPPALFRGTVKTRPNRETADAPAEA